MRVGAISCAPQFLLPNCFPYSSLAHRGQYKLEDGFRTMKDSEACCWWPMHHWTDQKIRVHGFFCVMALLLVSLLQRQLGQKGIDISIARLIRRLTEIEEMALAYPPRPVARGKAKPRRRFFPAGMVVPWYAPLYKRLTGTRPRLEFP